MNVLFFCHDDFACNSMGHIVGFAAGLCAMGHACAVAIPGDERASFARLRENPPFRPCLFSETWERIPELFPDRREADILHAWTPREHVRRAVERCREDMPRARLVVHLEDNEEHLAAAFAREDFARLRELPDAELAARLPIHLSHPREYQRFLRSAHGITGIVAELADFAPRGVPFTATWPAVDFSIYHPGAPNDALRESLGIEPRERMIYYPGSSHFANAMEMAELYEAVFLLNRRGIPCRLIRTGHDTADFPRRFATANLAKYVTHLGFVEKPVVGDLMRLADALVQPGDDDDFNRYRLPSKLPEFLASGRPVILPLANIGRHLRAGHDALLLEKGDAESIGDACQRVFTDAALARELGEGGARFAHSHFNRAAVARRLAAFYQRLRDPARGWWSRLLARRRGQAKSRRANSMPPTAPLRGADTE